ncbi:hypothetical protein [Schumannella soli]|uniref:Uncharacterized protein n=1 Tax=Schumannella soli TaxID=2590779 RepID=A0A506Y761_9MICO|nr:hypothetical protein [Schumannella soli]TPW77902.1 hypothetical protein FJ657_04475 [Schumannella soli]
MTPERPADRTTRSRFAPPEPASADDAAAPASAPTPTGPPALPPTGRPGVVPLAQHLSQAAVSGTARAGDQHSEAQHPAAQLPDAQSPDAHPDAPSTGADERDPATSSASTPRAAVEQAGHRVRALLHDVARRLPLRRTPPPPKVARVFDGHRDGVPCFAPERPVIVDREERETLLTLLRSGSVLVHAARPLRDDLGDVDVAVPADLRSDGTWIWSDAVAYYLEHHWIAPDAELVSHLRAAGPASPLDAETWRRLSAAIRPDAWEGTTWPLD